MASQIRMNVTANLPDDFVNCARYIESDVPHWAWAGFQDSKGDHPADSSEKVLEETTNPKPARKRNTPATDQAA